MTPEIPLSGDLAVGNIVRYDDKQWRVVHNDGAKWYLAAKDAITTTAFGSNTTYSGSTIYNIITDYLNGMTALAKKFMVSVTVEGVTSKIFLPTYDQANGGFSYYNSDANRLLTYGGDAVAWWLSSKYGDTYVRDVRSDGTIGAWEPNNVIGCRPHICIDTSITGEFNGINAGNYAFNMTIPQMPADQTISFKSNGVTCTQMINTGGVLRYVGGTSQNAYTYSSNTWTTPQCRKLEVLKDHEISSDITQAYYNWFNTNAKACVTLPAGSYKFNDELTDYSGIYEYLSMDYLSSGGSYTAITAIRYSGGYLQFLIGGTWSNMYSSNWIHTNYKNVRVNSAQYVSPDFYNWFTANTTKL